MKIAINGRFLIKGKMEGIGWYSFETISRLVKLRPKDEFVIYFDRAIDPEFKFSNNVSTRILYPPARHPILWKLWFEWAVSRALKKDKADIFYSPDGYTSLSNSSKHLMICHDIAHVHYPEVIPKNVKNYYDKYVPKFLNRADKILCVSQATKEDVINQYNIKGAKLGVAHNGCRGFFLPLEENQKQETRKKFTKAKSYFLFVGAIHPRKNTGRLLKAFEIFKQRIKSEMQLAIVGNFSWMNDELKTIYNSSQVKEDIHFLGYLNQEELHQITASAEALVYPSLFEGFGVPILEAMNCDVPVICSNTSSMPEVGGDAAYLIDPNNENEIADAMQVVSTDLKLRKRMIMEGKRQREKFSWDKTASIISHEIDQLAGC